MRLKIHQQRPQVELVSTTSDAGTHPPRSETRAGRVSSQKQDGTSTEHPTAAPETAVTAHNVTYHDRILVAHAVGH